LVCAAEHYVSDTSAIEVRMPLEQALDDQGRHVIWSDFA
jgi:hypothetical protein